ncbi:MAG: hypothetical protein ABSG53_07280 [Thermoguttaceae bacterium]|jgi:hypothetical protein
MVLTRSVSGELTYHPRCRLELSLAVSREHYISILLMKLRPEQRVLYGQTVGFPVDG